MFIKQYTWKQLWIILRRNINSISSIRDFFFCLVPYFPPTSTPSSNSSLSIIIRFSKNISICKGRHASFLSREDHENRCDFRKRELTIWGPSGLFRSWHSFTHPEWENCSEDCCWLLNVKNELIVTNVYVFSIFIKCNEKLVFFVEFFVLLLMRFCHFFSFKVDCNPT